MRGKAGRPRALPAGQQRLTFRGLGDIHQLEWESPEAHSLKLMGNFTLHLLLIYRGSSPVKPPGASQEGVWILRLDTQGSYTQKADERWYQCQQCLIILELLSVPLLEPRLLLSALQDYRPAESRASSVFCYCCCLLQMEPSVFLVSTHIIPFPSVLLWGLSQPFLWLA